jgi:hypothetical protein
MEWIGSLWILLCAAREWALRKPRAIGRIIPATRGGAAADVGEARRYLFDPAHHALVE